MTTTPTASQAATFVAPPRPQVDRPRQDAVTAPSPPSPPPAPTGSCSAPWMVSLLVLVTGMFMSVLYVSIVKRNAARASSLDDALRYMTFQQVQAQAFVTALDDLMMVRARGCVERKR